MSRERRPEEEKMVTHTISFRNGLSNSIRVITPTQVSVLDLYKNHQEAPKSIKQIFDCALSSDTALDDRFGRALYK